MAEGHIGDSQRLDGFVRLARDFRDSDDALHSPDVRKLGCAEDYIANGVDPRLSGLHPFVCLDEATLALNARLLQANVFGVRLAADSDQNLLRFDLLLPTVRAECYRYSRLRLLDFFNFGS